LTEKVRYPRVSSFKKTEDFRAHLEKVDAVMPCDDGIETAPTSPLAQAAEVGGVRIGNRFAIQPMEGWDGNEKGEPSDLTRRRWRNTDLGRGSFRGRGGGARQSKPINGAGGKSRGHGRVARHSTSGP